DAFLKYTHLMQHSYCIEPEKTKILKSIIQEKGKNNIIVFCKFIRSKKYLESNLDVKVLTYGKGALGLNLQKYNTIVFWDKTFDYALQEQAERRIYRLGQKDNCTFYYLKGDVGLENLINKNIYHKISML
ncbi:helicase SNF2, partial [Bifidobacterium sp. M0353]